MEHTKIRVLVEMYIRR